MRKRLLITMGLLILYLVLYFTPIIGINYSAVGSLSKIIKLMVSSTILDRISICSLGIWPYVHMHIIIALLLSTIPIPTLIVRKINPYFYIYLLTLCLSVIIAYFVSLYIERNLVYNNVYLVLNPGLLFRLTTTTLLTLGVIVTIWLGNTITKKGLGNGISLIVLFNLIIDTFVKKGQSIVQSIFFVILVIAVPAFILKIQKRIEIQYAENKSHFSLSIPLNFIGVIPIIFAQIFILFPNMVFSLFHFNPLPQTDGPLYYFIYGTLVFLFTYFCAFIIFNPIVLLKMIKSAGAFISDKESEEQAISYLKQLLLKITLFWGLFLAGLVLLPEFLIKLYNNTSYFSGSNLYLIVGICIYYYNQLRESVKKTKEIFSSPDPMIILMVRNLIEHKGIKGYIKHIEVYGGLLGLWFGPLADKRLLVDEQDYSKSKEIISKFIQLPLKEMEGEEENNAFR